MDKREDRTIQKGVAMTSCKLWYIRDSDSGLARQYSKLPKSRNPEESDKVWIAISQIEHTTRHPAVGDEWPVHVVRMSDWIAEQKGL